MPIPMKLSALTKALLGDGASAADEGAAAAAAAAASGPAMATRRRSALNRSASSSSNAAASDNSELHAPPASTDRPGVRQTRRHTRSSSTQVASGAAPSSSSRPTSPVTRSQESSSPAPRKRVVRLSSATPANGIVAPPPLRRSLSASKHTRWGGSSGAREAIDERINSSQADVIVVSSTAAPAAPAATPAEQEQAVPTATTPAGSVRRVQITVGSASRSSSRAARLSGSSSILMSRRGEAGQHSDAEQGGHDEAPATASRPTSGGSNSNSNSNSSNSRYTSSNGRDAEAQALPGSMRIKRVGKVLGGGFLSGPARRGRRRQSDEEGVEGNSPDDMLGSGSQEGDGGALHGRDGGGAAAGASESFYEPYSRDFAATGSPVSVRGTQRAASRERVVAAAAAVAAAVSSDLPSTYDKENETPYVIHLPKPLVVPPAAGRDDHDDREKHRERGLRAALQQVVDARAPPPPPPPAPAPAAASARKPSPERKVLAAINRNTPHRSAPPPPKMSVLETATTATAGAAATSQGNKKPRVLLKVNGRSYQRVDCVGRGGSAKVYKVTAENGKMFAMKRVSLENADETTIRGYLGEIDLLKKLSGVDRVIQLFDFEMNKEKQMLSLLMELGEMDLNSLLRVRQNPESARLDPVFVRFYWKEMLESLQAVHAHDIVHSDLKPANFVLVQGRLKLIDFGIANAIQTDETVNVHRETQIGTPNYMSPESLMDAQQYAFTASGHGGLFLPAGGRAAPKLMKLGKPSDVWSLGCILYQMVYGLPPFGHIQNQMARCQAIITWSHAIDFPARGLGGAVVPHSLLQTMRRCLNREQQLRPTCEDLLSPSDPFLFPETAAAAFLEDGSLPVSEELLGRIIQSVVSRCRERMPTDAEAMSAWPAAYWASVRRAVAAREER